MPSRLLNTTIKVLLVLMLVATPLTLAITIVGDLDYLTQGSAGFIAEAFPSPDGGEELRIAEVIPGTAAQRLEIRRGDRIVAVNDQPARFPDEVNFRAPGSQPSITLERDGYRWEVAPLYGKIFKQINLSVSLWIFSQAAALSFYLIGLVVAWKSRKDVATLLAFTCCFLSLSFNGSTVIRLPALTDFPLIRRFLIFGRDAPVFTTLAMSLTLHFTGVFPRPKRVIRRRPAWALLFYLPLPVTHTLYFLLTDVWTAEMVGLVLFAVIGCVLLLALGLLSHSMKTCPVERERLQAQVLFWGTLVGLTPHILYLSLSPFFDPGEPWPAFINVTVLLFPISFAYVVLQNRLLGVQLILTAGAKQALVTRIADLGFILVAIGFTGRPIYLIGRDGPKVSTVVFLVTAVGILLALVSVRRWAGRVLEERFFPRIHDARRTLRELGQVVVTVLDLAELLKLTVNKVSEAFHLARAVVLIRAENHYEVHSAVGYPSHLPDTVVFETGGAVEKLLEDNPQGVRLYLDDPECRVCGRLKKNPGELEGMHRLGARLLVPLRSRRGGVGFLSLGPKPGGEIYTRGEMGLMSEAAVHVGIAVENAYLTREVAAREQQRREVEKARHLQVSLLPDEDPGLEGLDVAGRCVPATEVAGDYYDYIPLPDHRSAVVLGDVTGHGLEAGMMMAVAKAALRTQVNARPDLPAMLAAVDRAMRLSEAQTLFMTAVLVIHDVQTGMLEYGIAGHPPPLLLRADGHGVEALEGGFYPLGIEMDGPYVAERLEAARDDCLLLYSDGILEARNAGGEDFGLDRLKRVFLSARGTSAKATRDKILEGLNRFVQGAPFHDDVTVVALKVR